MTETLEKGQEKRRQLAWYDILILTVIFWGEAIYTSTISYLMLLEGETTIAEGLEFTAADNYLALMTQGGLLLLALLYLRLRKFDFSSWEIRPSVRAVLYGGVLFLGSALLMDAYTLATSGIAAALPIPEPLGGLLSNTTVSTTIYALFNGMYEEIYFLGICLAVAPRQLKWALPFSLLVRVSFHTYQGMQAAIGIGIVYGLFMYFMYQRSESKNLLPFFVAHAIADVFGLGVLWFFSSAV